MTARALDRIADALERLVELEEAKAERVQRNPAPKRKALASVEVEPREWQPGPPPTKADHRHMAELLQRKGIGAGLDPKGSMPGLDTLDMPEPVAKLKPFEVAADCGIYFLLLRGEVVYVGQSECVHGRVRRHKLDTSKHFDRAVFVPCEPEHLDAMEAKYIKALEPPLNVSGRPYGRGR